MRVPLPGHHAHGAAHHRRAHHGPHHGGNDFEGSAAHYDRVSRLLTRPYRRIARDAVTPLPQGASVLDVGTGTGRLLLELGRLRPDLRLTGLDLAADMVETARRNLAGLGERVTVLVGDAADLPFDDGTFDLVISSLSLHHWSDPAAGGAEVARVVRAGGQIRVYDLRPAPFADLVSGTGVTDPVRPERFRITPLPRPTLRRLVLTPG